MCCNFATVKFVSGTDWYHSTRGGATIKEERAHAFEKPGAATVADGSI